jgi:RecB family endonuclease NucS
MIASSNDISIRLKRVGEAWICENEAVLEDLLWRNLSHFFDLLPLKRQFSVDGQICDILALGKEGQLCILELKNVQDRYVVNQLTRYYAALMEQKPFQQQIDYSKPVRLIAIAPSFHKDNLSDQKYSLLDIELVEFAISQVDACLTFQLKQDKKQVVELKIVCSPETNDVEIPSPSRALLNLLGKCSEGEYQNALKIRERILKFDKRIQEITGSNGICYGSRKTRLCAKLSFDKEFQKLALILWIPSNVAFKGLTRRKSNVRVESLIGESEISNSLDHWIDLALESWLQRLKR